MLNLQKDQVLLSRFVLIRLLGEGGMGQVWLVHDLELDINIAIKVLHPRLSAISERVELLKNECRNTRRLVHPNIVRVFDFHRTEDLVFISMEYIEGETLVALRRRFESPSYLKIISFLQPLVDALAYAHGLGLVHRDVKSGNVIIDRHNAPRLTDFGIAAVLKSGGAALKITSGGSLYCMSPQQLDGHQPQPSDDVYAFGVLMYELLTGRPPFYPDITPAKIRHEIPLPINQQLADSGLHINISPQLEELISKMIAKTSEERPADMQEIGNRLQAIHDGSMAQSVPPVAQIQTLSQERDFHHNAEIITPRKVPAKDKNADGAYDRRQKLVTVFALASAFVVILIGGGWLLHYLSKHPVDTAKVIEPRTIAQPQAEQKPAQIPKGQPSETPDPAELAQQKQEAEQRLAQYIALKNELDRKGASQWASDVYTELIALAQQGDTLFMDQAYDIAAEKYAEAIAKANALASQVDDTLVRLVEEGTLALNEGDGKRAQEKFSVALLIDPANLSAQRGLKKAVTIENVMQLVASGRKHENDGKLSFAHADYQEAVRLDPEAKEARIALKRVKEKIKEQEFQQLISDGLAAYHKNDYRLARTKLLKAKSFQPDSREVQDALRQVDAAIRLSRIEQLRKKAIAAEQSEHWEHALNAYLEILKVDANIQFAAQGKTRSLEQIRIAKRINFFLEKPEALEIDRQLENAILLANEAKELNPQGPRLSTQIKELEQLITAAQTPINVTIESDNFTDVAVYKVGKFGRFSVRQLNLRPGTYIVVGARDGYKDVRQKLVLKPGQEPLRIRIICKVKI
jgi:serine/threonine protein kinase